MRHFVLLLAVLLASAGDVLAGDVLVSIKSGALVVKGDDAGNTITIDGNALGVDAIRVTPGGGTTVNDAAGPQVFGGFASGATITFGSGADVVTITDRTLVGKVTIKTGKGSDRLTLDDTTLRGPTKIDLGRGDDALAACSATFDTEVVVKLGKGTGGAVTVDCGNPGSSSTLDASVVFIDDSTFSGALTLKAAAGVHVVTVNDTNVLGAMAFKNVALLALCYDLFGGPITAKMPKIVGNLGGEVECNDGSATAIANGNTAIAMAGATLNAEFTVKGGAGGDTAVVTGTSIAGATAVSLGAGLNFLFFDEVSTASLLAKAAKNDDDFFADALTVAGDATIKYGAGSNVIDLGTSNIGGDLVVKTGGGNDSITTNAVTVTGERTIDGGKGVDTIN